MSRNSQLMSTFDKPPPLSIVVVPGPITGLQWFCAGGQEYNWIRSRPQIFMQMMTWIEISLMVFRASVHPPTHQPLRLFLEYVVAI